MGPMGICAAHSGTISRAPARDDTSGRSCRLGARRGRSHWPHRRTTAIRRRPSAVNHQPSRDSLANASGYFRRWPVIIEPTAGAWSWHDLGGLASTVGAEGSLTPSDPRLGARKPSAGHATRFNSGTASDDVRPKSHRTAEIPGRPAGADRTALLAAHRAVQKRACARARARASRPAVRAGGGPGGAARPEGRLAALGSVAARFRASSSRHAASYAHAARNRRTAPMTSIRTVMAVPSGTPTTLATTASAHAEPNTAQ